MNRTKTHNTILYLAFAINTLLMMFLGMFAYQQLDSFRDATDKLYKHPFTVSSNVESIHSHIISMHRYMKDVAIAQSEKSFDQAVLMVTLEEEDALDKFRVVEERYLGDKGDVMAAKEAFLAWRPIREKVIALVREGNKSDAQSITQNEGARHVVALESLIGRLSDFARNKAVSLHNAVHVSQEEGSLLLVVLVATISAIAIFMIYFVFTKDKKISKELNNHLHLIDQNIAIATLNDHHEVLWATNALCRLMHVLPEKILNQPLLNLFETEGEKESCEKMLHTVSTGKECSVELEKRLPDGQVAWFHISTIPVFDEHFRVISKEIFFSDITASKENERLSQTDKLTSLLNRRTFDELFERQTRIAKRNKMLFKFAIIDIDFFKQYNDTYGHPKGDDVLKRVASCISATFRRADDYVFRLGGEEFGVIYSLTDSEDEGHDQSEELMKKIEAMLIPHESSSVASHITISVGVAKYAHGQVPAASIVYQDADKALYTAKKTRNCVVFN